MKEIIRIASCEGYGDKFHYPKDLQSLKKLLDGKVIFEGNSYVRLYFVEEVIDADIRESFPSEYNIYSIKAKCSLVIYDATGTPEINPSGIYTIDVDETIHAESMEDKKEFVNSIVTIKNRLKTLCE